jgi:hypothetical protein
MNLYSIKIKENCNEIVFSATGRTQKVVDVISSVFTEEKEKITSYQ